MSNVQTIVGARGGSGRRRKLAPRFEERDFHEPEMLPQELTIVLAGAGGNGSKMLSHLVRMDAALDQLGKGSLDVIVFDDDVVSETNTLRQSFYPVERNVNKALALVSRANVGHGLNWMAWPERYAGQALGHNLISASGLFSRPDVLITCVDSAKARVEIAEAIGNMERPVAPQYWLDLGNDADFGQVVLGQPAGATFVRGTDRLPTIVERWPDRYDLSSETVSANDELPSCGAEEALTRQSLFINDFIAAYAAHLLWDLIYKRRIVHSGFMVNLRSGVANALPVIVHPNTKRGNNPRRT